MIIYKVLKKTIIFIILLPFLSLIIGYYPFFLIKQQLIKQEIKQKISSNLPSGELTEFIFDDATFKSLKWLEKNEFFYNDHLFDVINISYLKDHKIQIKCIDDVKEKLLLTRLFEQRKTDEKNKQNKEELFLKLFCKDYLKVVKFTFKEYYDIIHLYISKIVFYISYVMDKPSPPPKTC